MKKTYVNADLQIVCLNKRDIVTASTLGIGDDYATGIFDANAPDRFYRFDNYWDTGY